MDEREELNELSGRVVSVVYANEENGYTVLRLDTMDGGVTTVVGTLPSACPGEELHAFGEWMTHPSHGRQFRAEYAERSLPRTAEAIYAYLAGRSVKGIGPATATLIVDRFGEKTLDVLENHPELLSEIRGIGREKAARISADFRRQAGLRRLMEFLCGHGLRPLLAVRLYRFYGEEAMDVLGGDPYILAAAHIGGSFAEADRLAFDLGCDAEDPNRVRAAVIFELRHNAGNGHCFIPRDKLVPATAQFISASPESVEAAIDELREQGQVTQDSLAGREACYLSELYEAETYVAEKLKALASEPKPEDEATRQLVARVEARGGIVYAPLQREALSLAARSRVMALTGGPGTGKTTSLRGILSLYDSLGIETLLTAPTGRAAKRMSELTGREASTIHRLLGAAFSPEGEDTVFSRDEDDPLECGAVVLDECSMVDITLIQALLKALPKGCRLVLVGDADQLPSVGAGNVLRDIIDSQCIPVVRLTRIFRQAQKSRIVMNAHAINQGRFPDISNGRDTDFFFLKEDDPERAAATIVRLVKERLPRAYRESPDRIQVLTPMQRGVVGAANLNLLLQQALNPSGPILGRGGYIYRQGDRVMQLRNNYDKDVFNGDLGYIREVDTEERTLKVDFDGKWVEYDVTELDELTLAYATTIHKAQGAEYPIVVMPVLMTHFVMLQRNLIYTGITRAKKICVLIGATKALAYAVHNMSVLKRNTSLRERLNPSLTTDGKLRG